MARTGPALKACITKNEKWWHECVFDLIDWDAHGAALNHHATHRTTLVKYIHQLLPIGKQVHCYDPKYPPS